MVPTIPEEMIHEILKLLFHVSIVHVFTKNLDIEEPINRKGPVYPRREETPAYLLLVCKDRYAASIQDSATSVKEDDEAAVEDGAPNTRDSPYLYVLM